MPERSGPGSREAEVPPQRLQRWLDRLERRHGAISAQALEADLLLLTAGDGTQWQVRLPFPPLVGSWTQHVLQARSIGLLLIRRGGWAVGLAEGAQLTQWRLGRSYVQSRTAAGGWSQQRYARRRDGQAAKLVAAAVDGAGEVLGAAPKLDGLVTGGDRLLVGQALESRRLASFAGLVSGRHLEVADPRLDVLRTAVDSARSILVSNVAPPPR